jgi:Development and cell death domain
LTGNIDGVLPMFQFDKSFIMLCNLKTEEECLKRNLFGDIITKLKDLTDINVGDVGFLLNFDKDELIGIFRASSKAQLNIEKLAWKQKFPAQVRVELIGELQRIKDATYILNKAGVGMRPLQSGVMVPAFPVHGQDVIEKLLNYFREPQNNGE